MNAYIFFKKLLAVQEEQLHFIHKLAISRSEAYNLLQETSPKALGNEGSRPDTQFKEWVYAIMYNIFIHNYRRVIGEQMFVGRGGTLHCLDIPQDSDFASIEDTCDLKELHRFVNSLPHTYKVPFSMHVSGFSYHEIAEYLGLPLETVKIRIFITRQKLQEELKEFV